MKLTHNTPCDSEHISLMMTLCLSSGLICYEDLIHVMLISVNGKIVHQGLAEKHNGAEATSLIIFYFISEYDKSDLCVNIVKNQKQILILIFLH